ncbi:MAG: hypothetical protein V3U08_09405, partial [Nitrospirales bacterium]
RLFLGQVAVVGTAQQICRSPESVEFLARWPQATGADCYAASVASIGAAGVHSGSFLIEAGEFAGIPARRLFPLDASYRYK